MAKHKKGKLPKRVAGVKIPKQWRKGGEALIAQAQSPEGRAAIAKGVSVVAGAAAAMAQAAAAKNPATAKQPAAETDQKPAQPGTGNPDALADAIGAAADAVLGRLFAKK